MLHYQSLYEGTSSRYSTLLNDLFSGRNCCIGNFEVMDSHKNQQISETFDVTILNVNTHEKIKASLSLELSPYENLLADKVDLTIDDSKIVRTLTEQTYSTNDEINH